MVSLIGMKGHNIKDGWTETNSSDAQLQLGQPAATRTVTGEGCVPFTGLKFSVRSSVHKPRGGPALPPASFHQVFISLVLVGGLTQEKNVFENGCKQGHDVPEDNAVRVQYMHTAPKNICCCLCLSGYTTVLISRKRGGITGEKVLGKNENKFKKKDWRKK